MTKEQLLKPRWKVIADYPGALHNVGDIIQAYENGAAYLVEGDSYSMNDFPALFKRLKWHEDRELSDMPEYVKDIDNGKIYKVASPEQNGRIWHVDGEMEHGHLLRWANKYTPIDKEEYDSFINQNKQP